MSEIWPTYDSLTVPSRVAEAFAAAGLAPEGVVRWGEAVPAIQPGVYTVSLTHELDDVSGALAEAPISAAALRAWIEVRLELQVDGQRATVESLANRLASFWLPDEVIVYIGRSSRRLRQRVREYVRTPLGARSPHAGGTS